MCRFDDDDNNNNNNNNNKNDNNNNNKYIYIAAQVLASGLIIDHLYRAVIQRCSFGGAGWVANPIRNGRVYRGSQGRNSEPTNIQVD